VLLPAYVFILPMRNWNSLPTSTPSGLRGVFILPMRNWNFLEARHKKQHYLRFHSTYEELKPLETERKVMAEKKFSFYLWGIETPFLLFYKLHVHQVFILPMRNWNWFFWMHPAWWFPGFHSTYEELKHVLCREKGFCARCFHSTYEELKPYWRTSIFKMQHRFHSTYELKRVTGFTNHAPVIWFSFYLWGIETLSR